MVSPPLPMEDQTDEDFFDNLVDDEVDDVGSVPSFLNNVGSSDEKAFANLNIDEGADVVGGSGNVDSVEGDFSEKVGIDDVGSFSVDDNKVEGFGAEGSGGVTGFPETVDRESSDHGVGGVSEYDPRMSGNVADTGAGIKEVKWCAYSGNAQEVSFSDYFNQIGDDADDPFADLDGSPTIPPGTLDGGLTFPSGTLDSGLTVPSGTLDGGLTVPSSTLDGGLTVPSGSLDGGLTVPSSTLDGGLTVPSGSLDGGLTVPSSTLDGGLAVSSASLDGGLTVPSATLDGGLTVPSATLDGGLTALSGTQDGFTAASGILGGVSSNQPTCSSSPSIGQSGEGLEDTSSTDYTTEMPDQYSIQYWESLYPGWKYDPNTGMWNQVDGFNEMVNNAESNNAIVQPTWEGAVVNSTPDAHHLQHTAQSVCGSISEESTAGTLSYWNQAAYGNIQYPAHMVFDAQYPGWYYDTIALEWRSLESYFSAINQPDSLDQTQQLPHESTNTVNYFPEPKMTYGQGQQVNNYSFQPDQPVNWRDSGKDAVNVHPGQSNGFNYTESTQYGNGVRTNGVVNYSSTHGALAAPYVNSVSYEQPRQVFDSNNGFNRLQGLGVGNAGIQNFAPAEYSPQHINHSNEIDRRLSATGFTDPNVQSFTQQQRQFQSPDGRPSHALVSFGFGGKLIVMKDQGALHTQPAYNGPDSAGGVINVLNVMEVAMSKNDGSDVGVGDFDYIRILCHQAFSGPLFSGNVGSKELNKWIDDRIANGNVPDADYRKGEVQKMLLSLLKIACQYYGKLRSAYGSDNGAKDNDCPESALAKLFSSSKRNTMQFSAAPHCLQNMASEQQIQATAEEVQTLLVSGRRMEALQCAQNGHLWGPAIVIATLLGEQFYGETVKQMALHQLVAGSPLRTLCLLIAGQPAEVFSNTISSDPQNGANVSQTSSVGPGCMLDDWEENLAIISANRTKGDELVITHLGDCIWRERGEVMAAHICYLVAEANIESYSESARLCLVGADHLKYPRTYASPQAIQRTELYEYAKVLGNSQFVLLPFQPYKFLYACMLAEVGKLSDSLKYCQAILKSLKTGRSPEVDAWRHMVSSFEERIKIHQQGGYATNFSRAKLVGKLLHLFDNTAHRVVGGLPPPTPLTSLSNGQHSEHDHQSRGPRVSTSQSTMAMSSLMTSLSSEGNNLKAIHNRSMSEPDFGRTPRKDESPKSSSSSPHDNSSHSGSSSRFGRFGSQILHKTVSLVLGSRSDRQAKLGETNKFYYDEKLKRWVEEGVEPQAEEMTLAPPPTSTAFMNGMPGHERKYESPNTAIHANGDPEYKQPNSNGTSAELPPIPSGSNHFSARGRMGVRARYVDTFNKGAGTPANSFQSPSPLVPAMKPAVSTPKIFIPTPSSGGQEPDSSQSTQQNVVTDKDNITSNNSHDSFSSPQMLTPISTIPRHPSMDKGMGSTISSNGQLPANARRTLSWGGGLDLPNHTSTGETKSSAEVPGFTLSA